MRSLPFKSGNKSITIRNLGFTPLKSGKFHALSTLILQRGGIRGDSQAAFKYVGQTSDPDNAQNRFINAIALPQLILIDPILDEQFRICGLHHRTLDDTINFDPETVMDTHQTTSLDMRRFRGSDEMDQVDVFIPKDKTLNGKINDWIKRTRNEPLPGGATSIELVFWNPKRMRHGTTDLIEKDDTVEINGFKDNQPLSVLSWQTLTYVANQIDGEATAEKLIERARMSMILDAPHLPSFWEHWIDDVTLNGQTILSAPYPIPKCPIFMTLNTEEGHHDGGRELTKWLKKHTGQSDYNSTIPENPSSVPQGKPDTVERRGLLLGVRGGPSAQLTEKLKAGHTIELQVGQNVGVTLKKEIHPFFRNRKKLNPMLTQKPSV